MLQAQRPPESVGQHVLRQGADIQGLVDGGSAAFLRGWARNATDPGDKLIVELRLANAVVATTRADKERADLVKHAVGDGRYAFDFQIEPEWSRRYAELTVVARAADGTEQPLPMRIRRPDIDPTGNLSKVLEATSMMHRQILEEVRVVGARAEAVSTSREEMIRNLATQVDTLAIWLARLDERLSALPKAEQAPAGRRRLDVWQVVLAGLLGGMLVAAAGGTYLVLAMH
jgi:hypothetical protein